MFGARMSCPSYGEVHVLFGRIGVSNSCCSLAAGMRLPFHALDDARSKIVFKWNDARDSEPRGAIQLFPLSPASLFSADAGHHEQVQKLRGSPTRIAHRWKHCIDADQPPVPRHAVEAVPQQSKTVFV